MDETEKERPSEEEMSSDSDSNSEWNRANKELSDLEFNDDDDDEAEEFM